MPRLAIIPARGGSKRISGKNIRSFCGKPIIAYSIEAAFNSGLFDEVMVSTDDEKIADVARKYGASVPFMRSRENSDDFATTLSVIREVLHQYSGAGQDFEAVCCIYATAPMITPERLREGLQLLNSGEVASVFPVLAYSFPIQRSLSVTEDAFACLNWPEYVNTRSQDLPQAYHDAGQWYWLRPEKIGDRLFADHSKVLVLSEMEAQDIDNEDDWKMAEIKYSIRTERSAFGRGDN